MLQYWFVICDVICITSYCLLLLLAELTSLPSDRHSRLELTLPKCGWVDLPECPCRSCRGAPPPCLAQFWELLPGRKRLLACSAGLCRRCRSVVSTHCDRRLSHQVASLWDMLRLWRRSGWCKWIGKMEATVFIPSPGCGTTASVPCARCSRRRRANCWCPMWTSTQGSTQSTSPGTTR